jgi:high-affinity iron transporter
MILWMMRHGREMREHLERKTAKQVEKNAKAGLFFLSFIAVYREGVETVIFLKAAQYLAQDNSFAGAIFGILAALLVGYFMFVLGKKIKLKIFFAVTGIILIFFAAGLLSGAIREFQEVGLSFLGEKAWSTAFIVSENSVSGSMLRSLFGYNEAPSQLQVIVYLLSLVSFFVFFRSSISSSRS